MFRNILVISDNLEILKEAFVIVQNGNYNSSFTYSCSPGTSKEKFNEELGVEVIIYDLKKALDINEILANHDLILSIHCKQFFPKKLVREVKCINVHPGYNPYNRGWYPQVFAIIKDLPIGATIHEMDDKIDHGSIISRELVEKYPWDTSKSLYSRVMEKEIALLENNLDSIIKNQYTAFVPDSEGYIFLKKDFEGLCQIDLNEKGTFQEFINRLRAFSHDPFKNAFFIDPVSKEKIFISVNLSKDEKA